MEGRKVSVTFEAPDEAAAIAWVMEMEKRPELLDVGVWKHEAERYVSEAVSAGKLSPGYGEDRRRVLVTEGERMGLVSPRDMTLARVQAWYDEIVGSGRLSLVSLNHYLTHLRVFGDWLVSESKMYENPCNEVKAKPTPDNTRDVFLSSTEVGLLLQAARESHARLKKRWPKRTEDYPLLELYLLLACECGMRKGEIDAARDAWVDLDRGLMVIPAEDDFDSHVWRRKGRSGRRRGAVVPLVGGLKKWFEEHGVPSPYLIKPGNRWEAGRRYRYDARTRVDKFLADSDAGHVTVHDLRRSFGSNRVSAGTSIEKVANWMGIAIQTAWKRYARFLPADADIEKGAAVPAEEASDDQVAVIGAEPMAEKTVRERLVELKGLLDAGLISAEDFELKKGEILGGL